MVFRACILLCDHNVCSCGFRQWQPHTHSPCRVCNGNTTHGHISRRKGTACRATSWPRGASCLRLLPKVCSAHISALRCWPARVATSTRLFPLWCWSAIVYFVLNVFDDNVQTDFCFDFLAELGAKELSQVPFPFFCIVCGFFPLIVFLDGNRKSNFALRGFNTGIDSAGRSHSCIGATAERTVNVTSFWKNVQLDLLLSSRHNSPLPDLDANGIAPIVGQHSARAAGRDHALVVAH